jgi:1-phosphofructokinase family hexose kinase
LHHLGTEVKALSILGGRNGETIRAEFQQLGLPASWIGSSTPTRVCTTLLDQKSGTTTEIVQNSAPVDPAELDKFRASFNEEAASSSLIVLTGSLPLATPSSFYHDLARDVRVPLLLDFRGPELRHALALRPLIVKPNREELASTCSSDLATDASVWEAMAQLNAQGAQWVVVTQGGGPVFVSGPQARYQMQPPVASRVVNPIGCGDCLAAGMALAIHEGMPIHEAIRFGIAAAVENVGHLLPSRLKRAQVERLIGSVSLKTL